MNLTKLYKYIIEISNSKVGIRKNYNPRVFYKQNQNTL
jgi:hypothetical protein